MEAGIAVCVVLLLAGCASSGTANENAAQTASQVAVAESEEVDECTFVTDVSVEPPLSLLTRSYPELTFMAKEDLRRQLRREAAHAGGDTVVPKGLEGGRMHAKTYECRTG